MKRKTDMEKGTAKILLTQLKARVASGEISFENYVFQKRYLKSILRRDR